MANIFSDEYIGTVVKINKEKRLVGVYIPKLMAAMYDGDATCYKFPTNAGLTLGTLDKNISATVTKTNYIWVKGYSKTNPLPDIGSKVRVEFIDDSPLMPFWREFNYNGDYQVIEEERYKNLFKFQVGDKTQQVSESDNVKIILPKTYNVTSTEENKNITFKVLENFNFYKQGELEKVINNLQKSMEYLETDKLNTFITNIKNLSVLSNVTKSTGWFKPVMTNNKTTILNNIDAIDYTKYLLSDVRIIRDKVLEIRDKINTSADDYYKLQLELDNFLTPYNKSIEEYITNSFNNDKEKAITNIKNSENLLDASKYFTYFNKLLIGLKDTYLSYVTYSTAFNALSNTVKTSLASVIDKPLIDTNIRLAFSKALGSTSPTTVDKYISYIKDMFPTTAVITYRISTDGAEYETVTKNTNKIFALTDSTDAEVEYNGTTVNINNIDSMPVFKATTDPIVYSKFKPLTWVDESKTNIFDNYYLIKNITAKPHYIGCFITYNDIDEKLTFGIVNDNNIENITYKLNNTSATMNDINTYINNINNGDTTIEMVYNTDQKVTLTINNNNSTTVNLLIGLISDLVSVNTTNAINYLNNIVKAEALYGRLDNTNKALVTNYTTLTAARTSYDTQYTNNYINMIKDVTSVKSDDYNYVQLATLFDNMTYSQQQLVDTLKTNRDKVTKIIEYSGLSVTRKTE